MGLYDWQNSVAASTLARHWDIVMPGYVPRYSNLNPIYAQQYLAQLPIGGVGLPPPRLEETKLPFISRFTRSVEVPALIPVDSATFRSPGIRNTFSVIDVAGRELIAFDSIFRGYVPVVEEAQQFLVAVVSHGRDLPVARMRAFGFSPIFGVIPGVDYTEFTEAIGDDGRRCVLPEYAPMYVMYLKRTEGETTLTGVYLCWRPIIAKAVAAAGASPFNYTSMVLPDYHVFEIGLLEDGETEYKDRVVVEGRRFDFDAGLARERLGDQEGTHFCCAITTSQNIAGNVDDRYVSAGIASVLQFPHAVIDRDSSICGIIEPAGPWKPDRNVVKPQFGDYFVRALKSAAPVGECAAFEWTYADCGKLVDLAHAAGAATTPPFPADVLAMGGIGNELPKSREWGEWPHSLYPFTPHVNAIQTLEGLRSSHEVAPQVRRRTPIFALRDREDHPGSIELYPQRQVFARTASLQTLAYTESLSPHASESAKMLRKHAGNAMVIAGKQILNVTIQFEPFEPENVDNVPVGVRPLNPVPDFGNAWPGNIPAPLPEDGWYVAAGPEFWWQAGNQVPAPPGSQVFGDASPISQGIAALNSPAAGDSIDTQNIIVGPVSPELEEEIICAQLLQINNIGSVGGNGVPQVIASVINEEISLPIAPLTGEYLFERFSIGGVTAAGDLFRHAGVGEWQGGQVFQYRQYHPTMIVLDTWQPLPNLPHLIYKAPNRTTVASPVVITETWDLRTDFVEMYCTLGVVLQEAGMYDPDLSFGYGDLRDDVYREHLVFDEPKGRIASVVTYTEGQEPRPALALTLRARSAMRATLQMDIDTSAFHNGYPWSLAGQESDVIAARVSGTAGTGYVQGQGQTTDEHHLLSTFEHQFNADETERLLAGESVMASEWNQPGGSPNKPHIFDYGGIGRRYKVTCTLRLEDAETDEPPAGSL